MQCIYLQMTPIDLALLLRSQNEKNKEDDVIDLDEKHYECLTGPEEYEPMEEDIEDYCSNASRNSEFFSCPRYKAAKAIKEAEGKVNH